MNTKPSSEAEWSRNPSSTWWGSTPGCPRHFEWCFNIRFLIYNFIIKVCEMRSNLFDHLPIVHEQHRNFQEQYTILRKEKYEIYYRSSEVIDLIWFLLCTLPNYHQGAVTTLAYTCTALGICIYLVINRHLCLLIDFILYLAAQDILL